MKREKLKQIIRDDFENQRSMSILFKGTREVDEYNPRYLLELFEK